MAGKLRLDWGKESPIKDVDPDMPIRTSNPAEPKAQGVMGPAGLAKAVVNSGNAKVGVALATLSAQSSCPDGKNTSYRCPLYNNGCYAEDPQGGKTIFTTVKLNEAAGLVNHNATGNTASPVEVAKDEAEAIKLAIPLWKKKRVNNWFRLHVVGDAVTAECARIISEAADLCSESSPTGTKNIWNYTHGWRTVPRSAWSNNISMLASCDTIEDLPKAHGKGYACAIVMPKETMEKMGKEQNKEFGNWFMLPNGFKAIPCPYEIGKIVNNPGKQCIECKYCMREDSLYRNKGVIVFAAHTNKAEKAAKELIDIDVSQLEVVDAAVPVSKNPVMGDDYSPRSRKLRPMEKDVKALSALFEEQVRQGLRRGLSEKEAVDNAKLLTSMYGHHFRETLAVENPGRYYLFNSAHVPYGSVGDEQEARAEAQRIAASRGGYAFVMDKQARVTYKVYSDGRVVKTSGNPFNMLYMAPDERDAERLVKHLRNDHSIESYVFPFTYEGRTTYEVVLQDDNDYPRAKRVVADYMDEKIHSRRKSNPEDTAADMYETFHGKPSEEILEVGETVNYHANLAVLGELVEIKVATLTKKDVDLSFEESDCLLCSNEKGTQLYIVGGDQSLDLEKLGFTGDKGDKDLITIGIAYEITYRTEKGFDKFRLTDYYHELGEETGFQPSLVYDVMNEFLLISGGEYKIKDVGIVN